MSLPLFFGGESHMKKSLQFLLISASLLALSACNPTTTNSGSPQSTEVTQVNSQDKEKTAQKQEIDTADELKLADAKTEDPEKLYADLSDKMMPFPVLNGLAVPYLSADWVNEEKSGISYTYADAEFRESYEKQLKSAGFEKKTDDIFVKQGGEKSSLLVEMTEGEGELVIGAYTTRDPIGRYERLPDKGIPYPLDNDAFAAEFAEITLPNDADSATTYAYNNVSKTFIESYEKRLKEAGFKNSRSPEYPPLYEKIASDKLGLYVWINAANNDEDSDYISELKIEMRAAQLGEP